MTLLYTTAGGRVKQKKGNFRKKLFAGPKNNALKRKTGRWGRK
ncbi:hypothetical protein GBL_3312 [Geobacillus kaustophilus GBlys]|uniref:Uncharacterized protein n=1 Tax=Geobacillus kaustophilus GBlys TaxID=1337888 RepID=U2X801_GEOKU|nr:hypothetical protein GBL_3312 [Geobacillus kaustophilus GBlys]